MSKQLPDWITPISLAEAGKTLHGTVDTTDMQRLLPLLYGQQEFLQVKLRFDIDMAGIRFLSGSVQGVISLACQRCLDAMLVPVQLSLRLGIVKDADAGDRLPEQYEPLIAGRDPVRLVDIIEDELLLCLPVVPMHTESESCESPAGHTDEKPAPTRENPFEALAELKRRL